MSTLTNLASDVVEIILNLFRSNKRDPELVESEQVLTEDEILSVVPETVEAVQSRDKPDSNANSELLELDSEEPNATDKPKNETEPDEELITLASETPTNLAANDPVNEQQRNRDPKRNSEEPDEPENTDAPDRTKSNLQTESNKDPEGLDDLAEQSIIQPEPSRPERRDTPDITEPKIEELEIAEASIVERAVLPDSTQVERVDTPDIAEPKIEDMDVVETTPEQTDTTADLSSREIITPDSFVTSDELLEANVVETSNNPSMPDKLIDAAPLEASLEGPQRFEFSDANELSIGAVSMDEPITMGALSETFQGTGANDPTMAIEGQQATLQMAAGQDFTQEAPEIEAVAVAPTAAMPTLGG